MNDLSHSLYQPSQVRDMDAYAIGTLGVDGYVLMERAGTAAYRWLRERWPYARSVAVVCGLGNNAGDGYIVARLALRDGLGVRVLRLGDAGRLRGDARRAADDYSAVGGTCEVFSAEALAGADVVVDAIFGTGLDRAVEGEWAEAIVALNAAGKPVLALDIPSGLHGGSGQVLGVAVAAEATITFLALKSGLFTGAGPAVVGELRLDDLALPAAVRERMAPVAQLLSPDQLASWLPRRPRDAHKGLFGHVLVIGGDHGMGGAARMAAEAAARVGAGLITVATRPTHVGAMLAARPELMCRGVDTPAELVPLLERATVVAVGPGLGQGEWGQGMLEQALRFDGPLVVDADALNLLAQSPQKRERWILTPHPGEAARLLSSANRQVQSDRFAATEALLERFGGVVVLKGAGTIVGAAGTTPRICAHGNPGMASGGMGDVLTGVIAALAAQRLPLPDAAAAGVLLHALAADDAAAAGGERGLLASDLFPYLRRRANP